MAITLEGGCRVAEMREGDPLVNGTLRIWNQIGRATGAQAISLRVLEFAPGLSPGNHNDACAEILYVLDCEFGSPVQDEVNAFVDGHHYNLDPNTGIYLRPRETFAIDNPGPHSVVLISSQCPDPDRAPFVLPLTTPSPDSSPPD